VLGNALGSAAAAALARKIRRDGGNAEAAMRDSMAKAREIATKFPRLRVRLKTAAAEYGAAPENSFEFGLGHPRRPGSSTDRFNSSRPKRSQATPPRSPTPRDALPIRAHGLISTRRVVGPGGLSALAPENRSPLRKRLTPILGLSADIPLYKRTVE
jgi:hypothetical protein